MTVCIGVARTSSSDRKTTMSLITLFTAANGTSREIKNPGFHEASTLYALFSGLGYEAALSVIAQWLTEECPTAATLRFRRDYGEVDVFALDTDGELAVTSNEYRDEVAATLLHSYADAVIGLVGPSTTDDGDDEWCDVPVNAVLNERHRLFDASN